MTLLLSAANVLRKKVDEQMLAGLEEWAMNMETKTVPLLQVKGWR